MSELLANPLGANQSITTFVSGLDVDGMEVTYWQEVCSMRADTAISRGQVLIYVAPTVTTPPSVTPMLAGSPGRLFAGVALTGSIVGAPVKFVTRGFVRALMSTTPAANDVLTQPTATGQFASAATAFDAANIIGSTFGMVMGARSTVDLRSLVRINHI